MYEIKSQEERNNKIKIAVFMGNSFWSTVPYDGLNLYKYIEEKSDYNIDLIMFKDDIRLKGKNGKSNKFNFDTKYFINEQKIIINNWDEFFNLSKNYKLLIMSTQIINKFNTNKCVWKNLNFLGFSRAFKKHIKCKVAIWDIGGADLLCWYNFYGDYFFTKGEIFSTWLEKMGVNKNNIFVTGSPHFDYFIEDLSFNLYSNYLTKQFFLKKYNINNNKKNILIFPSNLKARHYKQYESSMGFLEKLYNNYKSKYNFLIKTHPRDYLFYEEEQLYNSVQKRANRKEPYYYIFQNSFPNSIVIESQDHFNAIKYCDILINNAGSSTALEAFAFTKKKSYSINFKNQPYYKTVEYLPNYIIYPDDIVNIEINEPEELEVTQTNIDKDHKIIKDYISDEFSFPKILDAIKNIL